MSGNSNSQAVPWGMDQTALRAFGQNPFDFLIPDRDTTPQQSWRWATVYDTDPLRIRLDGDNEPLAATPVDMGGPRSNGDRVYAQIVGRRVVVFGPNTKNKGGTGGWVSIKSLPGVSIGTGVTVSSGRVRLSEDVMSVYVTFAISDLAMPVSGDVSNRSILRLPIPYRPAESSPLSSGGTGRLAAGVIDSGGLISITAVGATATWTSTTTADQSLSLGGLVMMG